MLGAEAKGITAAAFREAAAAAFREAVENHRATPSPGSHRTPTVPSTRTSPGSPSCPAAPTVVRILRMAVEARTRSTPATSPLAPTTPTATPVPASTPTAATPRRVGAAGNAGANSDIGQAMRAKVEGMANKIQGGGSSSSSTTTQQTQHQYNQQGRQMDRASARYNDALYNPDPLPVHGWSKQQGFKAGTINAALADPTMLLPAVFPGYASGDNPFSDSLESQPMTDLAMIMYGTQNKRGLTTKTPVVKVPHILAQNGTKPTKPATKRTLDPSAVTNKVAQMWGDLGSGS
jgi:hypothetical protein